MVRKIERNIYLNRLIDSIGNGMIKIVTGVRRSGKSFLLFRLFVEWLQSQGIDDAHILKVNLEDRLNKQLRDPDVLLNHIYSHIIDDGHFYVLLDEVQMVPEFEDVLNSFLDKENVDVFVTGSNARFLSKDVITEFRGRGEEIFMQPLSFGEFTSVYEGSYELGLDEYMTFGGSPQVLSYKAEKEKWELVEKPSNDYQFYKTNSFMRNILFLLCLLFCSAKSFGQYNNVYNTAYADFNNLIEAFLQLPTEQIRNEEIYNRLDELQKIINETHVSKEERYKLNSLKEDISVVKKFIAPISNKYNAHLSNNDINRLQTIFRGNFSQTQLNVKCPIDEVQFIEVKVSSLIICYFHCISKKAANGLCIKFHAASGNSTINGEYGALKNEYTPIIHNAGQEYIRVSSATITKRL